MATYGGDARANQSRRGNTNRSTGNQTCPAMAAMQDLAPDAGAGTTDSATAEAYVHRLATELCRPYDGSNFERFLLLLRQRPRGAGLFPADVAAALDELEELPSEGSAPLAALERDVARRWRAGQERALRDVCDVMLPGVDELIDDADADVSATVRRLNLVARSVDRTKEDLAAVAAAGGRDGGGSESDVETTALVLYLVERLGHGQAEEAALTAAMHAKIDHLCKLFDHRDAADEWVLAKETAFDAQPEIPPPSEEELDLVSATTHRYNQIFFTLRDFLLRENDNR
uniref:Uncharacterized protein n=1 Tax=Oryza brachyantha TaxID=4533 RepID=J3NDB9_ORYBR